MEKSPLPQVRGFDRQFSWWAGGLRSRYRSTSDLRGPLTRSASPPLNWRSKPLTCSIVELNLRNDLKRFLTDYSLPPETILRNSFSEDELCLSWRGEYKRLNWEIPVNLSQSIKAHRDEVLHVAFSSDGTLLATCSKDATVKVWWCGGDDVSGIEFSPVEFLMERNLHEMLRWKYTQFSEFNENNSLILVSGVHVGKGNTGGEIAIFEIDRKKNYCLGSFKNYVTQTEIDDGAMESPRLSFRCRVMNRPYDVFGCWFDGNHVLNGELYPMGLLNSASHLWLCKASQESTSERTAVLAPLCKFLNRNGANLRMIMVSSYVSPLVEAAVEVMEKILAEKRSKKKSSQIEKSDLQDSLSKYLDNPEMLANQDAAMASSSTKPIGGSSFSCDNCQLNHSKEERRQCTCICHGPVKNKLLIFSTGSNCYTPHQVAFKLVRASEVLERLNADVMPDDRRAEVLERLKVYREKKEAENMQETEAHVEQPDEIADPMEIELEDVIVDDSDPEGDDDWEDIVRQFDVPDHVIDVKGHVIGMTLTRDEKFLMVNVRPWPENYVIQDPYAPPELSEKIEVRVVNMENLSLLPGSYCAHKGFTQNEKCFFIFLDANQGFIASGSEDFSGYVWTRDYGCLIGELEHKNVVNSVAFNPKDPEMLVSVSDDWTIKVWRSKRKLKAVRNT